MERPSAKQHLNACVSFQNCGRGDCWRWKPSAVFTLDSKPLADRGARSAAHADGFAMGFRGHRSTAALRSWRRWRPSNRRLALSRRRQRQTPEISPQGPSSPPRPLAHEFADSPESRHTARETSTPRQPQTDNSPRRAGTLARVRPSRTSDTEKQSASHEPPLAPATESTVQPARGVRRALDHPMRPKKSPINTTLPILEEANADAPSTVGQTALQTPPTERIERSFSEPRPVQQPPWRKESRAPGPPLTGGRSDCPPSPVGCIRNFARGCPAWRDH